jgi:hypothetical protein
MHNVKGTFRLWMTPISCHGIRTASKSSGQQVAYREDVSKRGHTQKLFALLLDF